MSFHNDYSLPIQLSLLFKSKGDMDQCVSLLESIRLANDN